MSTGSKYGWIITNDLLRIMDFNETSAIGTIGPTNITPRLRRDLHTKGKGEEFRLLDDDRNIYYEGRIVGSHDGFEPLDDYGMPDSGCTIIQYRNKTGHWEDL